MNNPPLWDEEQLAADAKKAVINFRQERLEETLERYSVFFEAFAGVFENLLDQIPEMIADADKLVDVMADADAKTAFRYLAAPPISEDDLKILAETSLSASALKKDKKQAKRVRDIVFHIIDPHRFPWVASSRAPSERELETAIISSSALVAARKMETQRRKGAGKDQEEKVKQQLRDIDLVEIPRREIHLLSDAPKPGEFCGESKLGDTRADIIIGLYDRRVMPIECKVSNSEVNSFKRVNHEAVGKARAWLRSFGRSATVPAAVLRGVFKPGNLVTAQKEGLSLIWSHRLEDLCRFIQYSRD